MEYTKKHAAVCGLFCPGCSAFIATQEGPESLEVMAKRFGVTADEVTCLGCRSEKRIPYCDTCKLYPCAIEKGVDFCGECPENPCDDLKEFQAAGAHRFELWNAHEQIVKEGYEKWMEDMMKYYSCSKCGKLNSTYDAKCRSCGHQPSNQYGEEHSKEVWEFLANLQKKIKS